MKKCQYSKCGKEFEPNKPKQIYCCDVHRVYASREKKAPKKPEIGQKSTETKKTKKDAPKVSEALLAKFEAIKQQLKNKQNGKEN